MLEIRGTQLANLDNCEHGLRLMRSVILKRDLHIDLISTIDDNTHNNNTHSIIYNVAYVNMYISTRRSTSCRITYVKHIINKSVQVDLSVEVKSNKVYLKV